MLEVFNTQFWCDIVWALLHSVWQAAFIASLLGIALRQIPAQKAPLRYWLAVSAILSLVLSTFFTYHVRMEFRNLPIASVVEQHSSYASSPAISNFPAAASESPSSSSTNMGMGINWTALAALFWVVGVSVMVLRTIGAVIRGNHFSSVTPIDSPKHLELLTALSRKLGLRKVPSFWSSLSSRTPYAVGVLAPAIVVPMSMLTSLSSAELQAVLAHELAHIRRNDYLANLFQIVIEAVYFFNPAVWWISRQVRVEREACCDQIAIESASNQIGYATILANWMETSMGGADSTLEDAPVSGLAFADKQPSGMLERIQRILKPDSKPRLRVSPLNWIFVVAASLLIAFVMSAGSKAVTTAAARAFSDSERVAQIEEKQNNIEVGPNDAFEEGKTTITGRITTEDGGEVESGWLNSSSNNAGSVYSSTEGDFAADQEFEISVPSGIVWLDFCSKNYAPAIVGPITALKDKQVIQDVKLIKGAPHLIHVVDENGQPVSDVNVQMFPKSHGGQVWKTGTDDLGNYTFKHRNPGRKSNLMVEKVGYITQRMVVSNNGKTEVTLKASPISKGVVLSADGAPVANAEIRIAREGGLHLHNKLAAMTDELGQFETPLLSPTGIHTILVVSDQGMVSVDEVVVSKDLKFILQPACSMDVTIKGDLDLLYRRKNGKLRINFYQRSGRSWWDGDLKNGELEILEDSDDLVRVKLKRLMPGAFSLRSGKSNHTLEAKPGNHSVEITADAKTPTPASVEMVDLKVQFQCDGEIVKPSGSLKIGPRYNYFSPLEDGELKVSVEPKKYYLEPHKMIGFTFEPLRIEVKAGEANEISIEVEPAGAVSGNIVNANGEPVSASVSCKYEIRRPNHFRSSGLSDHFGSDSEGNFLLTPIPLGAKVIVKAGDRFNPAISQEVLIEASNPVIEVKLQTAPPVGAKLRVVDQKGNPIHGVDLSIKLLDPRYGSWAGSLSTDGKGEIEITPLHPTWHYTVTAKPKKGFAQNTVDLVQGKTNVLRLEPGCVVRGRLVDTDGNPVSKQRVYAQFKDARSPNGDSIDADLPTDYEGRFEFTRLPKAECRIRSSGVKEVVVDTSDDVDDQPIELRLEK